MPLKRPFWIFVFAYFGVRFFSFYFPPGVILNQIAAFLIIATVAFLITKKDHLGWTIVAAELLLGGSGSFLKLFELSARTWLLGVSIAFFFMQNLRVIAKYQLKKYLIFLLIIVGALGALNGFLRGNLGARIITDLVPYLFLLYFFPLQKLVSDTRFSNALKQLFYASLLGQLIFILFTFFGFSSGLFILQDPYYHWYRDIAGGKITFVEYGFYRLILNEQLLLVPGLIFILAKALENFKKYSLPLLALLFIFAINLTRVYFLGYLVGAVFLINKNNFVNWLKNAAFIAVGFILLFCGTFFAASGGQSFGLEVFGLRAQSIITPDSENSSLSRLLLLPKIIEKIKTNPIFGSGLGSTVTVYSPVLKKEITTPHFDWGYLEILAELGMIGALVWLFFISKTMIYIKKQPVLRAVFVSLLIINLTSPALFHVFGALLIGYILAMQDRVSSAQPAAPLHTSSLLPS